MKKKFSTGIYKGGFKGKWSDLDKSEKNKALKKQWYLRWSFRNPETGKMERQYNIYGGVNEYHSYKERIEFLKTLERNLIELLNTGFNPYNDIKNSVVSVPSSFEAIENALEIKKLHMKHDSFIRFKSDIGKFKNYLKANGFDRRFITSINKKTVTDFLNEVLKDVSNRSRNNYKTSISTLWQSMEDNGVIEKNFVKSIPMLKSKPQRNKTYSDKQAEELFDYMAKNYPNMLLFIKFVSYNFLRPIEVCRLTAQSINIKDKTLSVMVKQGQFKTKIIPDILINDLPGLSGKEGCLFTKDGLFGYWNASDNSKRGHFSRKFKEIKDHFGLGEDYGIYSFRHYYTTKLYRKLRETLSPYEAKSRLMLISGHESMDALEKYLRSIDAELPEDYSKLLE
ncbi:tyrosine-type recombinase/integrase [Joostella sp.]|uniref:tyrosine-type recombinase/integrase n=1 Tax=Joostella sp. TaxID=2231138 RepID=UPI003A8E7667